MKIIFNDTHTSNTIGESHLIREQVKVAPKENGDNLIWIVWGKLAAAELQLGGNLGSF